MSTKPSKHGSNRIIFPFLSDITIVSEKEGNTTIAHNGGRTSADLRPPSRSSGGKPDRSPSLSKINDIYELLNSLIKLINYVPNSIIS